jgi:hypothetical protein
MSQMDIARKHMTADAPSHILHSIIVSLNYTGHALQEKKCKGDYNHVCDPWCFSRVDCFWGRDKMMRNTVHIFSDIR